MTEFNKGFLVKLEGINEVNAASALKNKEVLADEKYIIKEDSFEYAGYIGSSNAPDSGWRANSG